ncbi:MAG: hypothetical protein GTO29_03760 [Candidatus Latescibacteria bacterium]|nr:hypothetical protein [Candidatus Latescibacterota bacterium]NIO55192.1 hypothetical protein [Candidatus Latescibacterota bacterium]
MTDSNSSESDGQGTQLDEAYFGLATITPQVKTIVLIRGDLRFHIPGMGYSGRFKHDQLDMNLEGAVQQVEHLIFVSLKEASATISSPTIGTWISSRVAPQFNAQGRYAYQMTQIPVNWLQECKESGAPKNNIRKS